MTSLKEKEVFARLPRSLKGLERLALNLRWSWDRETRALFEGIDAELWGQVRENPVALIGRLDTARLEALAEDPEFAARLEATCSALDEYMTGCEEPKVAYLSMEYGLHESVQLYSGGLGVLSGDHLKAASDLGVPLVAVGLLYRKGYFTQRLDAAGNQFERLPHVDPGEMPVRQVCDDDGAPLVIDVEVGDRSVRSRVWLLQVGKVALYLLDTDLSDNSDDDRRISWQLYVGDRRMRLEQEIVLGVGAVRLLEDRLGIMPETYHLNEGHCALSLIERLTRDARGGGGFEQACDRVRARTVFTTHTPVPAGNEEFDAELIEEHFSGGAQALGIEREELLGLGSIGDDVDEEAAANEPEVSADGAEEEVEKRTFSLTVLALKLSRYSNAVSRLHGEVCREMWRGIWPALDVDQVPISHITNGVHGPTWVGGSVACAQAAAGNETAIPLDALWRAHSEQKAALIGFIRRRLVAEGLRRGEAEADLEALAEGLTEKPLTVGFARRFATYKRGALLLEDLDALDALVNNPKRPMQLLFAGKAHPADPAGKRIIQSVFPRLAGRALRGAGGLRRGLRHGARAAAHRGRGSLAEQPGPAHGGLRHERHEGGHERGAQLLDSRRLVGRGRRGGLRVLRRGTVGSGAGGPEAGRGGQVGAGRPARPGGRAHVLRARTGRGTRPVGRDHAAGCPGSLPQVQRAPDGGRLPAPRLRGLTLS